MKKFLDNLKHEMLTQDQRSTSYPYFIIVEDKKVHGIDSAYSDDKERIDHDALDFNDLCEKCQKLSEDGEDLPEECDDCSDECFVHYRIEEDVPNLYAGIFFTAKAAQDHLDANHHHYNSTAKVYGMSAYHNGELRKVMFHLCGKEIS